MPGALVETLIDTAGNSCRFLEADSRRQIIRFIRSRHHPSGGFRGRGPEPDLYYSLFAVAGLRALRAPIPWWSLWRYVRSFAAGDNLDLVHLVALIQLRTLFPTGRKLRQELQQRLADGRNDSTYDLFFKLLAEDPFGNQPEPVAAHDESPNVPTPNLAAAGMIGGPSNTEVLEQLSKRRREDGGFAPTQKADDSDLLSTATALFALRTAGIVPNEKTCREGLAFVESHWCDSGGFTGHAADQLEDVEYTFYALLAMGCLTA